MKNEITIEAQIGIVEAVLVEHATNIHQMATERFHNAVAASIEQLRERGSSRAWAIYIGIAMLDRED